MIIISKQWDIDTQLQSWQCWFRAALLGRNECSFWSLGIRNLTELSGQKTSRFSRSKTMSSCSETHNQESYASLDIGGELVDRWEAGKPSTFVVRWALIYSAFWPSTFRFWVKCQTSRQNVSCRLLTSVFVNVRRPIIRVHGTSGRRFFYSLFVSSESGLQRSGNCPEASGNH